MIVNYGKFERYTLPEAHPLKYLERHHNVVFRRNFEGRDWYEVRASLPETQTYLTVNQDGSVGGAENDPTSINPADMILVGVDRIPDEDLDKYRFDTWRVDFETGELTKIPDPTAEDVEVPPPPQQATVVAIAELTIQGDEVLGVDTAVNIGAAFPLTPDYYIVYFQTPQPDASYLAFVQSPGFNVDVTWREAAFFELQVTDRLTGEPATPTSLTITVQRVR